MSMLVPTFIYDQNASAFTGGDGSLGDPFQISNVTELQNMSANLSAHYILINDIDASNTTKWNWNGTIYQGFIPIANDTDPGTPGFQGTNFTGSFDGRGFNITGLFINRSTEGYIGLFGRINASAVIKNVNFINCTIYGDNNAGPLIGYNDDGTVENITISGNINIPGTYSEDSHYIGGMIGYNNGPVTNCSVRGELNSTGEYAGGLIGYNNGLVTNCTSFVNISGYIDGGGYRGSLIGYNEKGTVINCTAYGFAIGYYDIGGLLGDNEGTVSTCKAYGNVTGGLQFGGLIGMNLATVTNCRSYGNVTPSGLGSEWAVGGLIGSNGGPVSNCISYGDTYGNQMVGGLIGLNDDNITNCIANGNTTGIYGDCWAVGGLIGEHYNGTITNCSVYGYVTGFGANSQDIGGLIGYVDKGTIKNCVSYNNTAGLENLGGLIGFNNGMVINCKVYGNVNCTGWDGGGLIGWNDGMVINCTTYGNMITTGQEVGGMVGWNDVTGTVIDCNVYGDMDCTSYGGGLIGYNDGKVTNCSVYGTVNGTSTLGGLIGYNEGIVTNCTPSKNVTGKEYYGGLIGWNDGVVSNCTAYSDLNGTQVMGGLIGANLGTVLNCIAYGNISGEYEIGGLIGVVWDGTIMNCTAFGNVTGDKVASSWHIGGLMGENHGKVSNCTAFGNVYGNYECIGGLIGYSTGDVTDCISYGDATSPGDFIGGLMGFNNGEAVNCTSYGNAIGNNYVGGLDGACGSKISKCTSYGNATGNWYVGGLTGYNYWVVTNSHSYGSATGNFSVGGLIGYNEGWIVRDCITYGDATGNSSVGGLVGKNIEPVNKCTSYGETIGKIYVGGLIGYNSGKLTNSLSSGNVTGNLYIGGVTGYNKGIVLNCSAYSNTTGNLSVGGLIGNNSGTVTSCETYGNTNGNISIGGLIGTNSGLVIGCSSFGNTTGNISVGGLIGNNSGTITNCTSYGNTTGNYNVGGVVGYNNGTVKNCTAYGNTTGSASDYIGGLIGINNGTIINSRAYGNITGNIAIGGLIGLNLDSGILTNCTAFGNVTGLNDVGGLIGNNSGLLFKCSAIGNTTGIGDNIGGLVGTNFGGTVSNSSAHGFATGNSNIGGLVGTNNNGLVTDCYSVGNVTGNSNIGGLIGNNSGTVITCFWDNETSGLTTSAGGAGAVGKNTTEMMKQVTFTSAGWDFINIWGLDEAKTYPFFVFLYNPPFIVTIDVDYATEDTLYYVDYEAIYSTHVPGNDIDEWNLTSNASNWLTIDGNGVLSGTPSNNDVGSYWVNITVTDRYNGNDSHNFTLTVINVNDPPIITTLDIKSAIEDVFYSVDYNATDIDPTKDTLTWHLETNATWLTIDALTGNLTGTPTNADVGTYFVNVSVDDNRGGVDFTNFTLKITNTNNLPIIISANVITATEDMLYNVDYDATDIDIPVNILTWTLVTDANWLSIDPSTGVLSGTPNNDDVGIYFVNVSVDDNKGGTDFTNFTLTVINTNDAPIIITADVISATEDVLYFVDYEATDIDPTMDTFTWALNTDAGWLSINSNTGNISGTPTNDNVGTYWVNITVDDGKGGTHSTNFTLTVFNVNDDPVITTTQIPKSATEDLLFSVDFDAEDIDPTEDSLTWHITTIADWLDIDSITGVLSGTPSNENIDSYWVNVTVDDGHDGVDSINFILSVKNVNDPPTITTVDIETAIEDELYSVDYEATDIDPTGDTFTWSLTTNAEWLKIDRINGILTGIPTNKDVDTYMVNVTVNDGNDGLTWHNFILTVKNVNDPPKIITEDVYIAYVNTLYLVDYNATDIDPTNDILTWSLASNASDWLTIDSISGILSGTPLSEDAGNYWINVTVSDGKSGSNSHYFILIVKSVPISNQNPVINTIDITTTPVGELYSVKYLATDDRTAVEDLKWSMETNATWLSFYPSTGILSGTPVDDDIGSYWIKITVDDGENGIAFTDFILKVIKFKPENAKPKLTNGTMSPESGDIDTEFIFTVTYTDEDNDPGNVWVWIDGFQQQMDSDPGDADYTDGVEYNYKTKLSEGEHTFYFTADDGTDEAESGDGVTPITPDEAINTPKITEPEDKQVELKNLILFQIITIIVIILIAIGAWFYKNKRKMKEQIFEKEKGVDERQEIGEGSMGKEFQPTEEFEIKSYEFIKELKEEAFAPETSDVSLSDQAILEKFEIKYSKGEISKATYDSIRESLIIHKR